MSPTHGSRAADDRGFSLVELLVVVVIVGILAAITIPQYVTQRERAWASELTSAVVNVALEVEAEAATFGGGYLGTSAAFADEGAFDAFVVQALAGLEGPAVDPVTYDADDGTASATRFAICMHHVMLAGPDGAPDVSVGYDSGAGGLQDPAAGPC